MFAFVFIDPAAKVESIQAYSSIISRPLTVFTEEQKSEYLMVTERTNQNKTIANNQIKAQKQLEGLVVLYCVQAYKEIRLYSE